jgi:hypothetical protein
MFSLNKKTNERFTASRLTHPVTGPASAPKRSKAFWLDDSFFWGDSEPLPSMFRPKIKACEPEPRAAKATLAGLTSLRARLSKWHSSNRTAPYIIASFLLLLAAVDGFLLTAPGFSADRRTLAEQALDAQDQDGTETALMFSATASDLPQGSQTPPLIPGREALHEGERWSAVVDALEQFLAEEQASKAAAIKRAENERLIRRLEGWVNAGTQKRTALAEACAGPARKCWKIATVVQ